MEQTNIQANQLAHMLAERLLETTKNFGKEYPTAKLLSFIGAGNLYLASMFMNAASKENALSLLEDDMSVIRNIILQTPDEMFTNSSYEES